VRALEFNSIEIYCVTLGCVAMVVSVLPGLLHWPPRWEEASLPSVTDLALVPVFALLFPLLRVVLNHFLFEVSECVDLVVIRGTTD